MEIHLRWNGPFGISDDNGRSVLTPPHEPGVYLWTLGGEGRYRPVYIGQSSNLAVRFYQHITSFLGGAYCLYEGGQGLDGTHKPKWHRYRPSLQSILDSFIPEHSELAVENLRRMTFFYAASSDLKDKWTRESVEAALIYSTHEGGESWLDNGNRGLPAERARNIKIMTASEKQFEIAGLKTEIFYGKLES